MPHDLERENAQLAAIVARLTKENSQLRHTVFNQAIRVDDDDSNLQRTIVRRHAWAIFGPTNLLPGSVYHLRVNAISYAVDTLGMPWMKCRRMGFICDKVHIVPAAMV